MGLSGLGDLIARVLQINHVIGNWAMRLLIVKIVTIGGIQIEVN